MKISIIIPVYNKVKYLEKILLQIRNQTFKDYECILIDDGSSDGSEKICDYMVDKDRRFTVIHIPNGGVSHARNVGLNKAKGEYITFIDSDDEIDVNYLQNMYFKLVNSKADLLISGYKKVWKDKEIKISFPYPEGKYTWAQIISDFSEVQKKTGIYGCCTSKLIPCENIKNIRFDETLTLAEDFDFYIKIYEQIQNIYIDNQTYYFYRQEAENSSSCISDDKIDYYSQILINIRYKDFLKKKGAYSNINKINIDKIISNYIFFTIFHSPFEKLKMYFYKLNILMKQEKLANKCDTFLGKVIVFLVQKNFYIELKMILMLRKRLKRF